MTDAIVFHRRKKRNWLGVRFRACHAILNAARGGRRICPGGTKEISRWSSEPKALSLSKGARANTTGSHPQNERTPEGVPEAAGEFPAHPPGRMAVVPRIRWCSLAKLARPPANFHDASGVAKCMTGSKTERSDFSSCQFPTCPASSRPNSGVPSGRCG